MRPDDPYVGAWLYTTEREAEVHRRWIDGDPYGDDCIETRLRGDRHAAVLGGLRSARTDVRTLLLEIRRLRERLAEGSGDATNQLHHRVEWTMSKGDAGADATFYCDAPEGAVCRLECGEGCDAEEYPCYSYDNDDNELAHELVDSGSCNALVWLKEGQPEETYGGGDAPLRSGPIEVGWDMHGCYQWSYPAEEESCG